MAILLSFPSLSPSPPQLKPHQNPNSKIPISTHLPIKPTTKRDLFIKTTSFCFFSLTLQCPISHSAEATSSPSKTSPLSVANTKSWFKFYGDGFAIRIPPEFEDVMEPQDDNTGLALYGDKVKPKAFAARFASSDGSEVVNVVTRTSNSLKITFLEAQDISNLGSLKDVAKILIPGGSTLYSARTIKVKEDEGYRSYYFYEFGRDDRRAALVAAVNSGKVIIAGATGPESKWGDDGVKLRSAAVSLTVL